MNTDEEWNKIVRNTEEPITYREIKQPDPLRQAWAAFIRAITIMASITWGLWMIVWVAGMLP